MPQSAAASHSRSAPVLAVIVCHNGQEWLPDALAALQASTIRPRHLLAVDTGSTDGTAELLAEASEVTETTDGTEGAEDTEGAGVTEPILDGVLTLPARTGFGAAAGAAVEHAVERWGDPGSWIWLLHDDCAPEPECLDVLLRAAEASPSAGVLGPMATDWDDPRLIVEAGLSTDASGHRQHAVPGGDRDPDDPAPEQTGEVLAVPSAGALVQRELWQALGGFDERLPLLRDDIDFGWRANVSGSVVLCVPAARLRHARAVSTGRRPAKALTLPVAAADRAHGLRTFLVNCAPLAFLVGLPRLLVLCLLRGLAFGIARDGTRAHAELAAVGYLVGGSAGLHKARGGRARGSVSGLFTSRFARLRGALRGGVAQLVRRRVASEASLGRLAEHEAAASAWIPPDAGRRSGAAAGPDVLPAGALRSASASGLRLRKPAGVVAVALPEQPAAQQARRRPSPGEPDVVFVRVNRRRVVAATVLAPPVILLLGLTALALVINGARLGLDLARGSLLPVGDLGELWSTYLAAWHPVAGGTAAGAPSALAVLGTVGAVFEPIGGPAALVALLLLGDAPLAALTAYAATRRVRARRWVRAGVAAAYALLPVATGAIAQGRLSVVIVHIALPPLLAGIVAVLTRSDHRWLSTAVLSAVALALVGAFSPLAFLLAGVGLLAGFVLLPWPGGAARAAGSLATMVLLPLGLLLPWLPTVVANPALLLHGFGGAETSATSLVELVGLDPGGPGALPTGAVLVLAALVAAVSKPSTRLLPGLALLVIGVAGVVVARLVEVVPIAGGQPAPNYVGVPLLFCGAGLLGVVLAACTRAQPRPLGSGHSSTSGRSGTPVLTRLAVAGGVATLLALAAGGVIAGQDGPLHAGDGWQFASSLAHEIDSTGRYALVLGSPGERPRQVGGRLPRYGDDVLVPVPGTDDRLARWQHDLLAGSREAVTSAAAAGVLFVVLPEGVDADRLLAKPELAGLVGAAPETSDGRGVLRLNPIAGQVTLLAPVQAHLAITGEAPTGEVIDGRGVASVDADLPDVRVRVSEGPPGRLLVLAAEQEPGWRALVDGERAPIVPAWGHQVAVAVPEGQSEVVLEYPSTTRNVLLLGQVAALLFALLTAIPGRRVLPPPTR